MAGEDAMVPVTGQAPGPVGAGPGLTAGMGEAGLVQQLNVWGSALELRSRRMEAEIQDLRTNLGATQERVAETCVQTRDMLWRNVVGFPPGV